MRLTVQRIDRGQEERHPRSGRLVPGGCRQQQVVAGKRDDVEGVLASVDGLEERLEGESLRRRFEQGQLARLADLVVAGKRRQQNISLPSSSSDRAWQPEPTRAALTSSVSQSSLSEPTYDQLEGPLIRPY